MTGAALDPRHLSVEGLLDYWHADVPTEMQVPGKPQAALKIDPLREVLTLRIELENSVDAPPSLLANISVRVVSDHGTRWLEISCVDAALALDTYPMLCAVADRAQLEHVEPVAAFLETAQTWRAILALRQRLTVEGELGLMGEVMLLDGLIATIGAADAVESWRGSQAEEHDFGLFQGDLETKTTLSDRRRHWIGGATQLLQTGSRPLWFLSVQLTRAGAGHGRTLPDVIDEAVASAPAQRDDLRARLHAGGWREEQRDLFRQRWELRSQPLLLTVDETFPRLTPEIIEKSVPASHAVTAIKYQIDVTGRHEAADVPVDLRAAVGLIEERAWQ